ncbi:MAG: flagellar protein [Thermoprotei archaeon]|nr:MAG: flagellar protein [Thermoprotei archaeon]
MGEVVMRYRVGTAEVTLLREGDSYLYVVNDAIPDELKKRVRRLAEVAIVTGRSGKGTLLEIIRAVKELLKGDEDDLTISYSLREHLKYGKLQILIDDPHIEDISAVGPGPIWVRHSEILRKDPSADFIRTNISFVNETDFIQHLYLLSERSGRIISHLTPILDANLPEEDGGHRIHLVLPHIAGGEGEIVIRKKKGSRLLGLKQLIQNGMLDDEAVNLIKGFIRDRKSLMIVGPPGSGKTTLLRAIVYDLIPKHWKVAIIEDTPEIDPLPGSSWVRYIVPLGKIGEEGLIDQMILTKAALRSSVNKFIIIGETRGAEARVLVQAMNMGMAGLTTFHGGTPREALLRLMSPPISLGPHQVTMFKGIITLGFCEDGGVKRRVISIDEPVYDPYIKNVRMKNSYRMNRGGVIKGSLNKPEKVLRVG